MFRLLLKHGQRFSEVNTPWRNCVAGSPKAGISCCSPGWWRKKSMSPGGRKQSPAPGGYFLILMPLPPKQKLHPFFPPNENVAFPPLPTFSTPTSASSSKHLSPGIFILFQPLSHNFPMKGSFAKQAEALDFPAESWKIYLPSCLTRYISESCKTTTAVESILPRL